MPFPYFEVAGTPYELGRQHGRLAGPQVRAFVEKLIDTAGRPREEVLQAALQFVPLFERHCPLLLEEVRGLAAGAELSFAEALLPQIRGEISGVRAETACTSFAISGEHTDTGGILIGQTSDMEREWEQYFLVLRLAPSDGPHILMWTFAGQLGYHGLNELGVAHFANSLAGGPSPLSRPGGLPHYPVKRRLYECRTRDEVLTMWRNLPVCSSGNYMLATGDREIFDMEITPLGLAVLEAEEGRLGHANHFLSPSFRSPDTDRCALPDSFPRQDRIDELLREPGGGPHSVSSLKELVSDHRAFPHGICRHAGETSADTVTVAALIAEPERGRLHVALGRPCAGDWTVYAL
jgi:isopenicillin-N N-acyltransferase-like protein